MILWSPLHQTGLSSKLLPLTSGSEENLSPKLKELLGMLEVVVAPPNTVKTKLYVKYHITFDLTI